MTGSVRLAMPPIWYNVRDMNIVDSDYHGSNKPDVTLGMDVSEGFIRPILDRLRAPRNASDLV